MKLLNPIGYRQQPRFECEAYLKWIREQGCVVCGKESVAHHGIEKSRGNYASDLLAIPLCPKHHNIDEGSYHELRRRMFEERYHIDLDEVVWSMITRFCEERGLNLRNQLVEFMENKISDLVKR